MPARNEPTTWRWVAIALALALFVAFLVVLPTRPAPLPFRADAFVSTKLATYSASPYAPWYQRASLFLFQTLSAHSPRSYTFPGSKPMLCSVQGLLDQCMQVSGTRYLMPLGVAAGSVQFGNTNVLNGPQWVAAFEAALQQGPVQCFDAGIRRPGPQRLVLLRFPAQHTVVVLPASDVPDFCRTNNLPATLGKAD